MSLNQHTLGAPRHGRADGRCLAVNLLLQLRQTLEFQLLRRVIGQICGGCAGAAAVDKTERYIEPYIGNQFQCR